MSLDFPYVLTTNERLILISNLNTMRYDNNRLIQQLIQSNNEIRSTINRLLNTSNTGPTNRRRNRRNNANASNYNTNNNNNTNNSNNTNTNTSRHVSQGQDIEFTNYYANFPQPQYIQPPSYFRTRPSEPINYNNINNNINRETASQQVQRSAVDELIQNFFAPIEVFPTTSQIENATRIVRYSDIVRPNNMSCPISLEPFRDDEYVSVIRFCNHIFNTNQLQRWFERNCRCPVCRYDIRNYSSNSDSNSSSDSSSSSNSNSNSDILYNSNENGNTEPATSQNQHTQPIQSTNERTRPRYMSNYQSNEYNLNDLGPALDPILNIFTSYATNVVSDFINSSTRLDVSGNVYTYQIDISGNNVNII